MKRGLKVDLIKKNPKVCLEFSAFNDFPDHKYKGHYHDYRSVIAKETMKLIDGNEIMRHLNVYIIYCIYVITVK